MADCISTLIDQYAIHLEMFSQPVASVGFEAHIIIHWLHHVRLSLFLDGKSGASLFLPCIDLNNIPRATFRYGKASVGPTFIDHRIAIPARLVILVFKAITRHHR